jgi:NADPH:quinone reductase-like Zn-dependent oxidoreductase
MIMKAVHFKEEGGKASESLEVVSVPKPEPKSTDLLVKLKACAVNPVDIEIR